MKYLCIRKHRKYGFQFVIVVVVNFKSKIIEFRISEFSILSEFVFPTFSSVSQYIIYSFSAMTVRFELQATIFFPFPLLIAIYACASDTQKIGLSNLILFFDNEIIPFPVYTIHTFFPKHTARNAISSKNYFHHFKVDYAAGGQNVI